MFEYRIPWKTGLGAAGLKLGLTFPAVISCAINVTIPIAAPGTAQNQEGAINVSGTMITGTSAPTLDNNFAHIEGQIYCSGSGNLDVIYACEVATASGIVIKSGAAGILWAMA